jgi:hypothetical protein
LNKLVNFHEIQLGDQAIEGGIEATFFSSRSFNRSKILDAQTSDMDAKFALISMGHEGIIL